MRQVSSYIFLKEVAFFAYHGVLPQEREVGNTFVVNLRIKTNLSKAAQSDELKDTVSYADLYQVLKEEMGVASQLLEHVCMRIAKRLFATFVSIDEIEISLTKKNPPMGADLAGAGVEFTFSSLAF